MALQKKIRNKRYKDFTKQILLDNNVEIYLDYVPTSTIRTDALNLFYNDYKQMYIKQYSKKYKTWYIKTPIVNDKLHEKGEIGKTSYYQVAITINGKGTAIPLHRIIYVWFNDIIPAYNENNEKMEICHKDGNWQNCHISNLILDTAKNNRATRKGNVNQ